jgi:type VI secretion system protein ImpE
MNARDLIKAGRLNEARKELIGEVKTSPSDPGKRTLLFQVLSFLGEWDKASRHLDTLAMQYPKMEVAVQGYRDLITAERARTKVVDLEADPSFLPETPPYFETYQSGLRELAEKDIEKARGLFDRADAMRPAITGTVNERSFEGFSDTDTLLSPFLEAFVHDRYVWIPFESIRELIIQPPKTLLDLLWNQAGITTWEGLTMNCHLPVLYPGSFDHEDEQVKLGRLTDWIPLGGPFSKGVGQHVFQIGKDELAILEIREVQFKFSGPQATGETHD